jgi:hypothetical protein
VAVTFGKNKERNTMYCKECGAQVADNAAICMKCGVLTDLGKTAPRAAQDNTALIPYKNPKALIAYYLGIFSLIPVIGFFLGCASVPLGVLGLKDKHARPVIRGSAHAWVGIIIGGLSVLVHLLIVVGLVWWAQG